MRVDWASWTPRVRATLMFVFDGDRVLLIRKKHGLGAGKINGPGGKLEPGETPMQAACRELTEEVGVVADRVSACGDLSFQFVDGLAMKVWVFKALGHVGEAQESDEAEPIWQPVHTIPYDQMWADDRIWLPELLAGRSFRLRAVFDGDAMLSWELERDVVV